MDTYTYIPVDPTRVPIQYSSVIDGNEYQLLTQYNQRFDFYTLLIMDPAGNPLYSTKLVYAGIANHAVVSGMPITSILKPIDPLDLLRSVPAAHTRLGKADFSSVRICLL